MMEETFKEWLPFIPFTTQDPFAPGFRKIANAEEETSMTSKIMANESIKERIK